MPAFLVIHPHGQKRDDVLIEGDDVTLAFDSGWAVLSDSQGPCVAIPCGQGGSIQRVDKTPEDGAEGA